MVPKGKSACRPLPLTVAGAKGNLHLVSGLNADGVGAVMRILRITPLFFRPDIWPVAYDPVGGLQIQVWNITKALDTAGISQTVITSHIPGSPRHFNLFGQAQVRCVGTWLPVQLARLLHNFTWFLAVLPKLVQVRKNYDLIHIHFNHSVWCRILAIVAGRLNVPVVVSLNTALWGGLQSALCLKGKAFDITRWIEKLAVNSADRIVTLTQIHAECVKRDMQIATHLISVIPDAIDVKEFQQRVVTEKLDAFRRHNQVPASARVVTYIGRISNEKGWQDIPDIVRCLSGIGVFTLICGDGPDRKKLESALAPLACPASWKITGFMPPEQVKEALQVSDVLVLPSRREAFGSVLLEAMASGVAAVAYATGGIVEVSGVPNAVMLVAKNDRAALVSSILNLLNDDRGRKTLVKLGHARVTDFSLGEAVTRSLRLYREVLYRGPLEGARHDSEAIDAV